MGENVASSGLPVAVDAMGSDLGPSALVEGAVTCARDFSVSSILIGKAEEITTHLDRLGEKNNPLVSVHNATEVISMDESPANALRRKRDASIRVAFDLVSDGTAGAVVSAGNTGAMMAAGLLVSGTMPGVARPAIASLIPRVGSLPPTVLLDAGANIDCHAPQLVQFAIMGAHYARAVTGTESPRVALLSNGSEPSKGNDITRAAAYALAETRELNFVGYVEGRDISQDRADVIVCDGFVGNVVLKTMEGAVELVVDSMRRQAEASLRGTAGMALLKPMLKSLFVDKLNPSAYGGAPLLGLQDIAVVCHGSSNQRAISNAIRVAKNFSDQGLAQELARSLSSLEARIESGYEDGLWNRMGARFDKKKNKSPKENIEPIEQGTEERKNDRIT